MTTGTGGLAERLRGRRVGVALSSAFFGFYGHAGFCRALAARGIEPVGWSGASAGAMVAAFAAARALERLPPVFGALRRQDFWDPTRFVGRPPGLLRGHKLRDLLAAHLPHRTFEALPDPLVTIATDLTRGRRHVDVTGALVPAVWASCALPILFRPVERGGALHADGGIVDKLPIAALVDHVEVDVVLAHHIPTTGLSRRLPSTPGRFIERMLDIAREDGWTHQAALAEARGIEVVVIRSDDLPRVDPFKLDRGLDAMRAAEARVGAALDDTATERLYGR